MSWGWQLFAVVSRTSPTEGRGICAELSVPPIKPEVAGKVALTHS